MKRLRLFVVGAFLIAIIIGSIYRLRYRTPDAEKIFASFEMDKSYEPIMISYPLDGTVFPPEIIAPVVRWRDSAKESDLWLVHLRSESEESLVEALVHRPEWRADCELWEAIKRSSLESEVSLVILGLRRKRPKEIISEAHITFSTSKDSVNAPIFYREVNLPFETAVKDPSKIRWRFGTIASEEQPPVILDNLPVCGNCHSFSNNGRMMGMDVDYANDKGSYTFTPVAKSITLSEANIITWSDYKREDKITTFGLLSQVSPDGRYVISTVKDRSVFVPKPELLFSQLFFPIKGILAYYDADSKAFHALNGADDKTYVQSNPSWSPDGRYVVFARNEAYKLRNLQSDVKVLLTQEECEEFLKEGKEFIYDLYRVPFNTGRGGKIEPLKGASNNGMSNYFAKYSPDGKWIVFCRAKSYMLLQPDSELYIIPAEGGEARRLECNTSRMNSWHSWSPNSRWLVFTSKENGPYTQLFLTHIDDRGVSSPPVLLENFTSSDRAANIPEFVNTEAEHIEKIEKGFINDNSYVRAGNEYVYSGDFKGAEEQYQKALSINPDNVNAHVQMGFVLTSINRLDEAELHCKKAIQLDPNMALAYFQLGEIECMRKNLSLGIEYLEKAKSLDPELAKTYYYLGQANFERGDYAKAVKHYREAIRLYPESFKMYYNLVWALLEKGDLQEASICARRGSALQKENSDFALANLFAKYDRNNEAVYHFKKAVEQEPQNSYPLCNLASTYLKMGEQVKAIDCFERTLLLDDDLVPALVGLSTVLSSSADVAVRNGTRAVDLAKRACELTEYRSEIALDVLAASLAECGRFSEAVETAGHALSVAEAKGNAKSVRELRAKIALYKKNRPFRKRF